ncbi:putative DNA-binding domain-containing protein [Sphingomicrobium sediminis]|uniref:DNA-binding domain-containing protein n=1 Tax=Sphingomicrobium sediminis TaxID=2950949 RepID=A0A9X2EFW0_9SPHN|nr:putative DNA-binding domain-containing protein [Sphingomicrobium sediminis]MCM8557223.1 DNA-binding domain-containing protein [Sphingomicrobium sediminis]
MRPDAQIAMRTALERGPAFVRDGLFSGSRAAQLRGLKAYANTISHARFVALEETFPRTREMMGHDAFHQLAEAFLSADSNLRGPIRLIGSGFPALVPDAAARDLAAAEWHWLAAHGAAEAEALTLHSIKELSPEVLVATEVSLHPATRTVMLEAPEDLAWDGMPKSDDPILLLTRPDVDVLLHRLPTSAAGLFVQLRSPTMLGSLLEIDADSVTTLIQAGALTRSKESPTT